MLNINNILHNLRKGKIIFILDLKQGYHQIPLTEDSKALTLIAFVTPEGLYEHNVLPMGEKDSPMSFCRIINQVLIGWTGHNTHVYLDDIIIQGINLMDNIDNLERVFL